MPEPVELAKQGGPVTIAVSPKNACRVRGRVTDDAGRPLDGARVGVTWHFQGPGAEATYGTSRGVEVVTTDADGRFTSGGLWPRDQYQVDRHRRGVWAGPSRSRSRARPARSTTWEPCGWWRRQGGPWDDRRHRRQAVGRDEGSAARRGPVGTSATTGPDGAFVLGGVLRPARGSSGPRRTATGRGRSGPARRGADHGDAADGERAAGPGPVVGRVRGGPDQVHAGR